MFSSALVTTNTHGSLVFVVAAADRKFKILIPLGNKTLVAFCVSFCILDNSMIFFF